MKENTKKILRRVGAAMLLGLSFLNFGSSLGGQRATGVSRRSQNVRKETQEEMDAEVQQVADIAETEALNVINQEMQRQDQEQEMQQQTQTQMQQTLKYAAIGGWGIAMMVFFTSAIFNQPFSLGKAALSLLPGEPHVATLTVVAEKELWQIGEEVNVNIELATNEEKANFFRAVIKYDPKKVEFQKINLDRDKFKIIEQNKVDQKSGTISLIAKRNDEGASFRRDVIANITFKALNVKGDTTISLVQAESVVIKTKKEDNKGYNILGKVKNSEFEIVGRFTELVKCQKIDVVSSRMDKIQWEWLLNSAAIPLKEGSKWVSLNDEESLLCAYADKDTMYLLVHSNKKIEGINVKNKLTGDILEVVKSETWVNGENNFSTVIVDSSHLVKEQPNKFRNLFVSFTSNGEELKWPERGTSEFVLEE